LYLDDFSYRLKEIINPVHSAVKIAEFELMNGCEIKIEGIAVKTKA